MHIGYAFPGEASIVSFWRTVSPKCGLERPSKNFVSHRIRFEGALDEQAGLQKESNASLFR